MLFRSLDMSLIHGTLKEVIFKLQEQNIQTRAIWGLIHEQKPYTQNIAYEMEKAQYYSKCILNIPCSTQLTQTEISYVVTAIKKVLGEMMHG